MSILKPEIEDKLLQYFQTRYDMGMLEFHQVTRLVLGLNSKRPQFKWLFNGIDMTKLENPDTFGDIAQTLCEKVIMSDVIEKLENIEPHRVRKHLLQLLEKYPDIE